MSDDTEQEMAAAPTPSGSVAGLYGRKIYGVARDVAASSRVAAYEKGELLAEFRFAAGGGELGFELVLPNSIYDNGYHHIKVQVEADAAYPLANGEIGVIGDPGILSPPGRADYAPVETAGQRGVSSEEHQALAAALKALRVQSEALAQIVSASAGARSGSLQAVGLPPAKRPPPTPECLGRHFADCRLPHGSGPDIIWLGVIDWAYRIQRPQHIAASLADLGSRVFYISIQFEKADELGRFSILTSPHPGVYEVRLRLEGVPPANIYGGFTPEQVADIQAALDELIIKSSIAAPDIVVEFPSWYPVAIGIPGANIIHDCLDLVSGFSNVGPEMVALEEELIRNADLVVTTSAPLAERIAEQRETVLVRNAADVEFFAAAARPDDRPEPSEDDAAGRALKKSPVIGYFGAIAEWFEIDWITAAARQHPDWRFELVGLVSGCDTSEAGKLPNVKLFGEQPYASLPERLAGWDVAMIPFKLVELIQCTNPVKLYEYMAGGKPVVATAMPEVVNATELVYIASDAADFSRQIARALAEDSRELAMARQHWASQHTWKARALEFRAALEGLEPRISVVVLCYNNWAFTRACLHSLELHSEYRNLEIIIVDNASTDMTRKELEVYAVRNPGAKIILNDENLGYAAGNNVGIAASTGDFVVLLNNDTYVTRGWARDLIRPMRLDPSIGLVGPLTNNIGNEQKVKINYRDMQQMASEALKVTRRYSRRRLETHNLAFFCVAIRRAVIERIGGLDEEYALGFFEDDDYCRRVEKAGYKIAIADDVFMHHHLSASFNSLGAERKRQQMERNKAIYEGKWGGWNPHAYRASPEFG